jgi:hypothetical protein
MVDEHVERREELARATAWLRNSAYAFRYCGVVTFAPFTTSTTGVCEPGNARWTSL